MKKKNSITSDLADEYVGRAAQFRYQEKKSRQNYSEESVHDYRVSIRRLLVVESLLCPACKTNCWKKDARHIFKQLSRLRDLQVLLIRFRNYLDLYELLSDEICSEISRLKELEYVIEIDGLKNKVKRSLKLHRKYSQAHPGKHIKSVCRRWLDVRSEMNVLINDADLYDYRRLHKLRIQFKSLRYLSEILVDAGILSPLELAEFKKWQEFLGNIQDLGVAVEWLEANNGDQDLIASLVTEREQQCVAFWMDYDALIALLKRLDVMIADSTLSCR